jgi:peptide/nickel transport system permease protein
MKLVPGDPAVVIGGSNATPPRSSNHPRAISASTSRSTSSSLHFYGNLAAGRSRPLAAARQAGGEATIERLPVTIGLSLYALSLTLLIGIASGIIAALRQNTWIDQAVDDHSP